MQDQVRNRARRRERARAEEIPLQYRECRTVEAQELRETEPPAQLVDVEQVRVLDQVRTVDRERLLRRLGALKQPVLERALKILREMFEA